MGNKMYFDSKGIESGKYNYKFLLVACVSIIEQQQGTKWNE